MIQCYTVGKSRGSIAGLRHSNGLSGLMHEPGGLHGVFRDHMHVVCSM